MSAYQRKIDMGERMRRDREYEQQQEDQLRELIATFRPLWNVWVEAKKVDSHPTNHIYNEGPRKTKHMREGVQIACTLLSMAVEREIRTVTGLDRYSWEWRMLVTRRNWATCNAWSPDHQLNEE